jgi:hypothetical protein
MSNRANSHAQNQGRVRQVVREIHWQAVPNRSDWVAAHRSARIDARCKEARERNVRRVQGRGGRCG